MNTAGKYKVYIITAKFIKLDAKYIERRWVVVFFIKSKKFQGTIFAKIGGIISLDKILKVQGYFFAVKGWWSTAYQKLGLWPRLKLANSILEYDGNRTILRYRPRRNESSTTNALIVS